MALDFDREIGLQRVGAGSVIKQRQREHLQVEPADSFGVLGIQPMPLDAVLTEFATASVQFVFEMCETK
jgi:hypothetical protein